MSWSWAEKYCGLPTSSRTRETFVRNPHDLSVGSHDSAARRHACRVRRRSAPARPGRAATSSGWHVLGPSPADELVLRPPEDPAHRAVHAGGPSLEVDDHGADLGLLEDDLEACLGRSSDPFRLDPFGVVDHRPVHLDDGPIGATLRDRANSNPSLDPVRPPNPDELVSGGTVSDGLRPGRVHFAHVVGVDHGEGTTPARRHLGADTEDPVVLVRPGHVSGTDVELETADAGRALGFGQPPSALLQRPLRGQAVGDVLGDHR